MMTTQTLGILTTDPMAEAGRKIIARQLAKMKQHEDGSRSGEDIESVHQMRVAIRRMRSLFKLIGGHYKPKLVRKYGRGLRDIARSLGLIRDLDVLILDLRAFQDTLSPDPRSHLGAVIQKLARRRHQHQRKLNTLFDSKAYRRFVNRLGEFSAESGKGAVPPPCLEVPHQVRHVLPILLYERLARVRAYETVLPQAEDETLHALRVEFKQLRYALEFFQPILGTTADSFIFEIKAMQDTLGRMNDIAVFIEHLRQIGGLETEQAAVIESYVMNRGEELASLRGQFRAQWDSFNQQATQRQFADALLVLR